VGIEYVVSNALGLMDPITDVVPESHFGILVDIIASIWCLLAMACVLGLVAELSLMERWINTMPDSYCGFARYFLIYIPILVILTCFATGGVLAQVEDWSFTNGFYFMAGQICGLSNPLTSATPSTAEGCFVEALTVTFELVIGGAVIGIVSGHPIVHDFIRLTEGKLKEEIKLAERDPLPDNILPLESPCKDAGTALSEVDAEHGSGARAPNDSRDVQMHDKELESTVAQLRSELLKVQAELAQARNEQAANGKRPSTCDKSSQIDQISL
jgi:hypothetical protein